MLKARHPALAFSNKGSKQPQFWILEILAGNSAETFTNRGIFCCWIVYLGGRSRMKQVCQQDTKKCKTRHCNWSLEGSGTPGLICSDHPPAISFAPTLVPACGPGASAMSRPGRNVRHRRSYVAFLPALNTSTFQYHFQRYLNQEWAFIRLGRHREPDASECLRKFDGGYQLHSGQSLWGAWEQQFQDCSKLRGRYIIFCPALRQSRAWRLDTFAVSKVGELMSQVWASDLEDDVLYRLANQVGALLIFDLGGWVHAIYLGRHLTQVRGSNIHSEMAEYFLFFFFFSLIRIGL